MKQTDYALLQLTTYKTRKRELGVVALAFWSLVMSAAVAAALVYGAPLAERAINAWMGVVR